MSLIEGSKRIAEYLNWVYIPFNNLQGLPKPGWYEKESNEPKFVIIENEKVCKETSLNITPFRYNSKNGWFLVGDFYYRFICRNHSELRFYNSLDALIPVIKKIELENPKIMIELMNGGCLIAGTNISYFDKDLTWSENVFNAIVKYLKS